MNTSTLPAAKARLDGDWLASLGLTDLTPDGCSQLLAFAVDQLQSAVGKRLADSITTEQLNEFEEFVERDDEAGALALLGRLVPNYPSVVREEVGRLGERMTADRSALLAIVSGAEANG